MTSNITKMIEKVKEGVEKVRFFQGFYTCTLENMPGADRLRFDEFGADIDAQGIDVQDIDAESGLVYCDRLEHIFKLDSSLFNLSFESGGVEINLDFCAKEFKLESELINFETSSISDFEESLKRLEMMIKGEF